MNQTHEGVRTIDMPSKRITLRLTTKPLKSLRLDLNNPRLRDEFLRRAMKGRTLTEYDVQNLLWRREPVKKLYNSIITSGGLSESIMITNDGLVVEGNERLVALRFIQNNIESPEDKKGAIIVPKDLRVRLTNLINHVPCEVLPDGISKAEIDILLGRAHVSGKDEWPAFNQAAHVYEMNEVDGIDIDRIADYLGRSRAWVYQRLRAYQWTKEYFSRYPDANINDYSIFEELYKIRAKLAKLDFNVEDQETMELFEKFVNRGEFGMAINVRKLPELLENEETRTLVMSGKLGEALHLLSQLDPSHVNPRLAAIVNAKRQLSKLTREDVALIAHNMQYRQILEDLVYDIKEVLAQTSGS